MATDVKLSSEFIIIYGGEVIAYATDFTLERNKEVVDITKLGDTWKNKKTVLKDFSVSFNAMVTRGDTITSSLWDEATAYSAGAYVVLAGNAYEAQGSTTGDNPTTDDGTNWIETSNYAAGTTYAAGDMVYLQTVDNEKRIYISLVGSNIGNLPSSSPSQWERLETNYESLLNELSNNDTPVKIAIKPLSDTETYYYGDGVITSLSASVGVADKATFAGTFEGTGELVGGSGVLNLGPILNVSTCVNFDFDTFSNATSTGFDATASNLVSAQCGTVDEISIVIGTQYSVSFDLVLNSGTPPSYDIKNGFASVTRTAEEDQLSVIGSNQFTFTSIYTTTCVLQFQNFWNATDFEVTNLSVNEVL